jgi:signal transduction histidine kinase
MKARTATRLAWSIWAITIALTAGAFLMPSSSYRIHHLSQLVVLITFFLFLLGFATVGAVLIARQQHNPIGWLLASGALCYAFAAFAGSYLEYMFAQDRSVPWAVAVLGTAGWIWATGLVLGGGFVLLLFPDGHLASRRWRVVGWLLGAGIASLAIGMTIQPGRLQDYPATNPIGIPGAGPISRLLQGVALPLMLAGIVGAIASVITRFRRARSVEREQFKWLVYAVFVVALGITASALISGIWGETDAASDFSNAAATGGISFVPIAIGIAVLRYRLYDIDVVINKTVVFGALAAFITAVYVAIVVGIGALIGSGNKPNLALSILATAVVAVAFQPVRDRVQRFANRLVYGHRATPYEVLSAFSDRVAETYATEEVLPRMARTIADGTGAAAAQVWLVSEDRLVCAAAYPDGDRPLAPVLSGQTIPDIPGTDKAIQVVHQGQLLGALTVSKPAGEPLTPTEDKLLADLASQAGLVLKNVGLTAELLARLDDLRASRQRLVKAQDDERRRLERDLHDGAQQHLVALKTRLSLAKRLTDRDPHRAEQFIAEIESEASEALDTLRDLARGIYPPLLADRGLKSALEAQATKAALPVHVEAEELPRYSQEVEAAVYFCCLEALQNVAKYADANRATVRFSARDDELNFIITDDGRGFDPSSTPTGTGTQNMIDRIEALGGRLSISSMPNRGTTVTGTLSVRAVEPVT